MSKIKKFFNCVIAGKEKPTKAELRNSIIELLVIIFFSVLASLIANIYFLKQLQIKLVTNATTIGTSTDFPKNFAKLIENI